MFDNTMHNPYTEAANALGAALEVIFGFALLLCIVKVVEYGIFVVKWNRWKR